MKPVKSTKNIVFYKYHGTGNDFIIIDGMSDLNIEQFTKVVVQHLCDRHLGIGADGLIIPIQEEGYDFRMVYYNSDGRRSSFCGNGSRCISLFMTSKGYAGPELKFIASDGPHYSTVYDKYVKVRMKDVNQIDRRTNGDYFMDTGSPHYVRFADQIEDLDIIDQAHSIRYNSEFTESGTNVNFVSSEGDHINMRTYERGVEDETLSCGTGVVAAALATFDKNEMADTEVKVLTRGGELSVQAQRTPNGFEEVYLSGPVKFVFKGEIDLDSIS